MMKILATCGNGMGSSLIMEMKVKNVLNRNGVDFDISHCSLGEALTIIGNFDVVFCPAAFYSNFPQSSATKVIPLKNVLSEDEITAKCKENQIF